MLSQRYLVNWSDSELCATAGAADDTTHGAADAPGAVDANALNRHLMGAELRTRLRACEAGRSRDDRYLQ